MPEWCSQLSAGSGSSSDVSTSISHQSEKIICHPSGDVFLRVKDKLAAGSKGPAKSYLLRVSTNAMSTVSKPFEAMFSTRYQEGQNLSTVRPPTVVLPDDDAQGMIWLCKALHLNIHPEDLKSVAIESVLELLVIAHKYDCFSSVRGAAKDLLTEVPGVTDDPRKLYYAFTVSYIIDYSTAFREYSAAIVEQELQPMKHLQKYTELESCQLVPPVVWHALSERVHGVHDYIALSLRKASYHGIEMHEFLRLTNTQALLKKFGAPIMFHNLHELVMYCEDHSLPLRQIVESLRSDVHAFLHWHLQKRELYKDWAINVTELLRAVFVRCDILDHPVLCLDCLNTEQLHPKHLCRGCKYQAARGLAQCNGCDGHHDEADKTYRHA